MKILRTMLSFLSFFFVPQSAQADGYQTWYLAALNEQGETLSESLGRTTITQLEQLLQDAGIDLHLVEEPANHLSSTTFLEKEDRESLLDPIFEENGMIVGFPSHAQIAHHLRIKTILPLEELSDASLKSLHQLINRSSLLMQEIVGHADFVLAKGDNWVDLIPSTKSGSLDFVERCDRLQRLYYPDGIFNEKQFEISKKIKEVWKKAFKESDPKSSYPLDSGYVYVSNLQKGLKHILEILAYSFRSQGFFLVIEEKGELPFIEDETKVPHRPYCPFCSDAIIESQTAYEGEYSRVLYNYNAPLEGAAFMVIPKRHCLRFEELTEEESLEMFRIEQSVKTILEKRFGHGEVVVYTQNTMPSGQTVPHSHTKIEYRTPILFSLYSLRYIMRNPVIVSKEEMASVTRWLEEVMQEQKAA